MDARCSPGEPCQPDANLKKPHGKDRVLEDSIYEMSRISKFTDRRQISDCYRLGQGGKGEVTGNRYRVSSGGAKYVLKLG